MCDLERKANIKIEHHAMLPNSKEMIKNIYLNKEVYKIYQNIFRILKKETFSRLK